ncbi:hypothetical protein [Mycoplasma todarodis]|uniref:Uncharacterized protein n=1 Tax=Mycoplasma todarodis TaxID=1937191 RepID=A0A4R0XSR8_9MOLU|nr:hypothetical protein [Mycoplasma todarodis]TCG11932.1 hypothetical protein C4B25_00310 [Mycoplasma todarodis]
MKKTYFTENDLQEFEEDYDVLIQPDQNKNKQVRDSKLLTCFIYLIATIFSIGSYFLQDYIIEWNSNYFTLRLILTIVTGAILLIPTLIFAYFTKLKWNYKPWLKNTFIFFNISFITIFFYLTLPLIAEGQQKWFWVFFFPISITVFKIMNIYLIKSNSLSCILRWILILLIGFIPFIIGITLKQNTIIFGSSWVLIWELSNEVWDLFFIRFIFKGKDRSFPYYPFFPIVTFVFLFFHLCFFCSGLWWFFEDPKNPFRDKDDDKDEN